MQVPPPSPDMIFFFSSFFSWDYSTIIGSFSLPVACRSATRSFLKELTCFLPICLFCQVCQQQFDPHFCCSFPHFFFFSFCTWLNKNSLGVTVNWSLVICMKCWPTKWTEDFYYSKHVKIKFSVCVGYKWRYSVCVFFLWMAAENSLLSSRLFAHLNMCVQ